MSGTYTVKGKQHCNGQYRDKSNRWNMLYNHEWLVHMYNLHAAAVQSEFDWSCQRVCFQQVLEDCEDS